MIDECGFHYAGPFTWNSLPAALHELSNSSSFKRHLKAVFLLAPTDPSCIGIVLFYLVVTCKLLVIVV